MSNLADKTLTLHARARLLNGNVADRIREYLLSCNVVTDISIQEVNVDAEFGSSKECSVSVTFKVSDVTKQ